VTLDLAAICPDVDDPFALFFLDLGYDVRAVQGPKKLRGGGKRSTVDCWYELYDGGALALQISMPSPPVAELIADLPRFIDDEPGVGPTDYWCACADGGKLRELLARAQKAKEAP
jgi:hypothetical protein